MVYTTQQKEEIALRFSPETKVECLFAGCWVQAVVRSCWYQEDGWPADTWSPYQLELENGSLIFAPADDNRMIRLSAPSPLALRLVPTVAAVKAEAGMEEAAGGEEAPASPAVVAEFGAMRLSDSLFDLCDVELPSPTSSAGGLFPSGQSTDSLPPLGRSSFSTDSSASARNLFSDPFASETDCPGLADSLPRMSTHGPSIPQLFSADESSLVLEEVSNDMHISPYASSAAAAAANPWCSELSPLPSVGQSERSEGAARVYKMSLARSMTDEAEQFKQDVLAIKSEAGAQGEPEPAAPGPLVVSTESLRRPGGLWADFGAPPALTPAANFLFSQQQQQQPPPQQQQSRRAEEPQDPHELRARAASGPPRLEMHGEYEKQIGRLRGLQEMLMHARAEFGLTDRRYLEVRRRVVACEAGLSTFCTGPHESFDLNPLSVSGTAPAPGKVSPKRVVEPESGCGSSSKQGGWPGCQPKVKKKRVMPPDPARKKATPWSESELVVFRRMLDRDGPGDWKSKAAELGTGRSVKSLHTRWLRDEGRIVDLPRYRNPTKRHASALQKATKGLAHITSNVAVKLS